MRYLFECFLAALRYAWSRRFTLISLQAVIWAPVYSIVALLPVDRGERGRMLFESLADPLWVAALLHLCRADLRHRPIGVTRALQRGARSYPRLFGIRTVLEARILVGLGALLLPGLVLFARYALMDVLAICEKVGPTQCRKRSRALTTPRLGSLLAFLALISAAQWGISRGIEWFVAALGHFPWAPLSNFVSVTLTAFLPLTLFEYYRRSTRQPCASGCDIDELQERPM